MQEQGRIAVDQSRSQCFQFSDGPHQVRFDPESMGDACEVDLRKQCDLGWQARTIQQTKL